MSNESHISFYLPTFRIHIFSKAIADIGNPQFIRFLIKDDCTSMAMEAYRKKDFQSHHVPKRTDERWEMEVRSMPLCLLLKNRLGWDEDQSYRIPGKTYPAQKVAVFDLTAAEPIQK